MKPYITVIVCTHKPHPGRLSRTLDGLRAQTYPHDSWEFILVDNGSPDPVDIDKAGLPETRIIRENRLGLTFARLAGISSARANLLIFVDDDNVLIPDYLKIAYQSFSEKERLGLAGGNSIPEWEQPPPVWIKEFAGNLAIREYKDGETQIASATKPPSYPSCAPIGAGMIARRGALESWVNRLTQEGVSTPGRRGKELTSGEDCDIVLDALASGWDVGYLPTLSLKHLIPAGRIDPDYLARLNHGIAKSWVSVLDRHGIRPWKPVKAWTVPLRKARAWLSYRVWRGPVERIRWKGACGQFEGRAALSAEKKR